MEGQGQLALGLAAPRTRPSRTRGGAPAPLLEGGAWRIADLEPHVAHGGEPGGGHTSAASRGARPRRAAGSGRGTRPASWSHAPPAGRRPDRRAGARRPRPPGPAPRCSAWPASGPLGMRSRLGLGVEVDRRTSCRVPGAAARSARTIASASSTDPVTSWSPTCTPELPGPRRGPASAGAAAALPDAGGRQPQRGRPTRGPRPTAAGTGSRPARAKAACSSGRCVLTPDTPHRASRTRPAGPDRRMTPGCSRRRLRGPQDPHPAAG